MPTSSVRSTRDLLWYDVFTDRPFAGNALVVVPDATGLDDDDMRRLARELNVSETSFVLPPQDERTTHRVRIFTPGRELAFAGHPTVGTAVALAELAGGGDTDLVLGLGAGPTPVRVRRDGAVLRASFVAPRLPRLSPSPLDLDGVAALLGIDPADVDASVPPHVADAGGTEFLVTVVRSLDALGRCRPVVATSGAGSAAVVGVYVAAATSDGFRSRMFAPEAGIPEDPATGAATVAFAGSLVAHVERFVADGTHEVALRQGVEMGRPSDLALSFDVSGGAITEVRLAGSAVRVLTATMTAPLGR